MKRENGLDFARVCGVLGIVVFHFYCHSSSEYKLFFQHANGGWGAALNHLFFALSGLVLHMKYEKTGLFSTPQFYFKRWKALIPTYWIVYIGYSALKLLIHDSFDFASISPIYMLLTIFGLDGYFSLIMPTYHLIGDWFLGAIIVAYLVYPILRFLTQKVRYITFAGIVILYIAFLNRTFLGFSPEVSPITCILSFHIGMLFAENFHQLKKPLTFFASAMICLLLICVPMGGRSVTKDILCGLALLVTLYNIGTFLCRINVIRRVVTFISGLSYSVFLIHHVVLLGVLRFVDPSDTILAVVELILVIAVILLGAKIVDFIAKTTLKCKCLAKWNPQS